MPWRKWLVRGLVFSVLGLLALGVVAYQAWTNPAAVRAQVLAHLHSRFADNGVSVSLDSAQFRLLGGIAVSELRIARTDNLDRKDFLYVPSAVIYHDKERLAKGIFAVRKVELVRPQLRVVHERDGRCNLTGLFVADKGKEPLPTMVVEQGTLVLEDRAAAPGSVVLEIKDVALTAIEDPPGVVTVAGRGRTDVAGPVRFNALVQRATGDVTATVDAADVPVGPELVQRLAGFCPEAAAQVRYLQGAGKVQAHFAYHPGAAQPCTYEATCQLVNGELSHARLPMPLEKLDATIRVVNGQVPFAHFTAHAGDARLELTLKDVVSLKNSADLSYDSVRELDLQIDRLPVTNGLMQQMPDLVRDLNTTYRPTGPVNVTHTFRRDGAGKWRKHWVMKPQGMEGEFRGFAYPVGRVTGTVDYEVASDQTMTTAVDLTGYVDSRPVTLKGKAHGAGSDAAAIDLEIAGDDLPLDEKMFKALPESGQKIARQFLPERSRRLGLQAAPMGRADVKATIHREQGKDFVNRYLVRFHDASVQFDVFPLPLEKVNGELDLRTPGGWACRGFRGAYDGGVIRVEGRSYASPTGAAAGVQDRIYLVIQGDEVPVDTEDFKNALAPSQSARATLRKTWDDLFVGGSLGFKAVVDEGLDQPKDIDVSVSIHGCSLRPRFFPYTLDGLTGAVRYTHEQVYLTDLSARHGDSVLNLKQGRVVMKPGGGFQARLQTIRGAPLAPDADFLEALPDGLRASLKGLHLRGSLTATTDLVVDAPEAGGPVALWWDGAATLHDAALQLGVELTGVEAQAACCGLYNGHRVESLVGNIVLERAELFGQPLQNIHTRFEVEPNTPDTLRFRDLKADFYGGTIGGEGRVECGARPRYELTLKALQIDLAEFARGNNLGADAQMKGRASAAVHLTGDGADVSGLKGNGRIDVSEGKLYKLPLQLDLLKAFGLRLPDRTAFEQAHAVFAIDGPQLQVQSFDLYGNAVSLRGKGTVDLDGSNLNLDFYADWGRLAQVLPAGVNDIPRAVSDQLLKIKMRGRISDPRFEKELAPGVVDWVERAIGP
jgi:AsmA-like C-terminal region